TEEKAKLNEVARAFRLAMEYVGSQLKKLRDLAIRLSYNVDHLNDPDYVHITKTISKLLLSPVWYPPSSSATDTNRMALPFEMRMWFRYWKYLNDTEPIWANDMTKLPDLSKMFKRLKEIKWQPDSINYQGRLVKIIDWNGIYEYYDMSSLWRDR